MACCFWLQSFLTQRGVISIQGCGAWNGFPPAPLVDYSSSRFVSSRGAPAMCHWNQEDTLGSEGRFLL